MDKQNENLNDEFDVVNIPDDSGKDVPFELIKVIKFEDNDYAILHPLEPYPGLDEDSCVICQLEDGDDDTVNLIPETDDDICDSVYALYVEWATNVEKNNCNGSCEGCPGCGDSE